MIGFLFSVCLFLVQAPPGWEQARQQIPDCHWHEVRSVLVDRDSNAKSYRSDLSIHLTPRINPRDLWHETGHIFMYTHPDVEQEWQDVFWPNGHYTGQPVSLYARTNYREDFAETYMQYIEFHAMADSVRLAYMRDYVFR